MCHLWRLAPDPLSCVLTVCPADGRAVWCQLWAQRCWLGSALFRSVDIWGRRGALNMATDTVQIVSCPAASSRDVAPFVVVRCHAIFHLWKQTAWSCCAWCNRSRISSNRKRWWFQTGSWCWKWSVRWPASRPGPTWTFPGFGHLQHRAGFLRDGPKTEGESERWPRWSREGWGHAQKQPSCQNNNNNRPLINYASCTPSTSLPRDILPLPLHD